MFDNMEQVNFYHLKPNHKYMITDLNGVFYYIGTFNLYRNSGNVAIFKNVICTSPIERSCGYMSYSYSASRKFYTLISKKKEIQQAMETRALNKILKQIIGDPLFEWN